jgi:dTDP-4-dehydrorhamnose reductase
MKECWLITGADGQLGRLLSIQLRQQSIVFHALGTRQLNITSEADVFRCFRLLRPTVVVNCAAWTAVDKAEVYATEAWLVNAAGAGNVARAAASVDALMIQLSTDYVFAGDVARPRRESDPVGPLSTYGASKLAGEMAVTAAGGRALIVRTSWLFGPYGRSFLSVILDKARQGLPLRVVHDQTGTPTWAPDLVLAIQKVVRACLYSLSGMEKIGIPLNADGAVRLVHYAGDSAVSWYQLASNLLEVATARGVLNIPFSIQAVSSAEFGALALRPAYSALASSMLPAIGLVPSDWQAGVQDFLQKPAVLLG